MLLIEDEGQNTMSLESFKNYIENKFVEGKEEESSDSEED